MTRKMSEALVVAVASLAACTTNAFLLSGGVTTPSRVQLKSVVKQPSVISPFPDHRLHASGWAKSSIIKPRVVRVPLFSSSSSSGSDSGAPEGADPDAVQKETDAIREATMSAGQIKAELDSLGVGYVGLLEKAEFVHALAEARTSLSSSGTAGNTSATPSAPVDTDSGENPTTTSEEQQEQEQGDVESAASDDSDESPTAVAAQASSSVPEPETKPEPEPEPEPEMKVEPEPEPESEPIHEVEEPAKSEPEPVAPTEKEATPPSSSDGGNDEPSSPPPPADKGTSSSGDVGEEVAKIREARMTAGQIKAELNSLGVSYVGFLEKAEFVQTLAEARVDPGKFGVVGEGEESGGGSGGGGKEEEVEKDVSVEEVAAASSEEGNDPEESEGKGGAPSDPVAAEEEPVAVEEIPVGSVEDANGRERENRAESSGVGETAASDKEEISAMRISLIKKELDEREIGYQGLFEKSEFVDLLVDARARGITTPAGGSDDSEQNTASATPSESENDKDSKFDSSYKDLQVKKMNNDSGAQAKQQEQQQQPTGGMPPGGMPGGMGGGGAGAGGFDIGSILSGLGGMGGAGGGAPGGAGAGGGSGEFDIGSIMGAMGAMGGAGAAPGASPPGGGGGGGMGDILSKVMNNPKAMEAFKKAQSNPKVMAAIQDVTKNGMGAMGKYANDPEIQSVISELKDIF